MVDESGWIRINPAVYFIDHLPVHVELLDVLVVVGASLAIAVLATVYPSRAAASSDAGRGDSARMSAILEAQGLRKVYEGGDGNPIEVLAGVDLEVGRGEFVAIVGSSGSGKSTLLHLLGALDAPSAGEVRLDGRAYGELDPDVLAAVRNRKLGFVFQFHHLLREFTALENVMLPLLIAGEDESRARSRAEELLAAVGLAGRMTHRPSALSGGEQQRTAVARALAADPLVILADEP